MSILTDHGGPYFHAREETASMKLKRALTLIAEIPAAILVVAEVIVLFAGVMARYVFQAPLVWSDELASILFLWLAMLGSVIALQRSEHMRLTAVVSRMSPAARRAPPRSPVPPWPPSSSWSCRRAGITPRSSGSSRRRR